MKKGTARSTSEEMEIKARVVQLTALHKTLLDITAQRDLTKLRQAIVRRAARLLKVMSGGLFLCDAEKHLCTCAVSYRTSRDYTGTVLRYDEGAAGKVAASGQPLLIDDYRIWEDRAKTFDLEQSFRTLLAAPMLWHGQATGVIVVLREQPFTQADLDLLTMFAGQAAIAVENARVMEAERSARIQAEKEINERKQVEEALHASDERYRLQFQNVFDGIFSIGRDLKFLDASPSLERMSGYKPEELIGKSILDLNVLPAEFMETAFSDIQRVFAGEKLASLEYELISKDGTRKLAEISAAPQVRDGETIAIVCVARDITERKQAEQELLKLNMAVDTSVEVIFMTDLEGIITFANPAFTRLYGYTSDEVVGKTTPRILKSGVMKTEGYAAFWQTLLNKQVINGEVINKAKDGRLLNIENSANPILNQQKEIIGFLCIQRDVTERKRVEEALRNREGLLQKIFDILPVGLWIADKDGQLLRGNPAGVKIWGAEPKVSPLEYGVFKGSRLPSREEVAPDDWALVHTIRDRVTIVDELLEIDAFDGQKKTILNYTAPVLDAQGDVQGAIVVNQDITERRRSETELAQSHEQLRALTLYWQTALEDERAHIARELHDEFGQSMTALKMDLAWLTKRLPKGDEKIERIRDMDTLVDDSIALMRRIATDLRPALLDDLGLNAALEWQAQEFSQHWGIPCKLKLPKDDLDLDQALSTSLFRIFQETLTNINRHAQATRVNASLKQNKQTLVLTIQDNGRGITEGELTNPRSLGLLGLRERAAQ